MIYLYNKSTGDLLGEISDAELQFLIDQMEEESTQDQDYSITNMEIEYFAAQGADPHLITLLRQALGDQNEAVILWSRSKK
jgi:hypothetical protein